MREAVRAIVLKDNKLLVMHRNRFGTEYDTLPGGGVEPGESHIEALHRELAEETSVIVSNVRHVFIEQAGNPYGTQYIFLADYVSGEPTLAADSEEAQIHKLGSNLYIPQWISLDTLESLPFVSEKLKRVILEAAQHGFPDKPTLIS